MYDKFGEEVVGEKYAWNKRKMTARKIWKLNISEYKITTLFFNLTHVNNFIFFLR